MSKEKPRLIIIAGPNGSGKTSVTNEILQHDWTINCEYINPDNIANDLYGDWNSPEAVIKAVNHAQNLREEYISNKQSFIFETGLSATDKVTLIKQYHPINTWAETIYKNIKTI
jgi:predicted ABC-type ATPase